LQLTDQMQLFSWISICWCPNVLMCR